MQECVEMSLIHQQVNEGVCVHSEGVILSLLWKRSGGRQMRCVYLRHPAGDSYLKILETRRDDREAQAFVKLRRQREKKSQEVWGEQEEQMEKRNSCSSASLCHPPSLACLHHWEAPKAPFFLQETLKCSESHGFYFMLWQTIDHSMFPHTFALTALDRYLLCRNTSVWF